MTITLNEEQVKQLDAFIQELPTKYGLPLTQFLSIGQGTLIIPNL